MKPLLLAESYVAWHYGRAYSDMFRVWMNLIWFIFNFFSIFLLLSTFFQPWKRMDEAYPKGFDPGGWASVVIVNILMRLVGMAARGILILFGLALASLLFLAGILVFIIWTIMPLFLAVLILLGMYLLLHG